MTFKIEYSNQALKFLKQADKTLLKRIFGKVETLSKEPVIQDSKTIEGYGEKLFRVSQNKKIGIVKIGKRSKVYQH